MVIKNPTDSAVSNLHFSLDNLVGGAANASIDSASAANCMVIQPHSQCNVKVDVTAGAVAGSFGFKVNNDSSLLGKLSKSVKSANEQNQTVGVEQAAYNSLSGADGITLSYYHTVIDKVPYILVSGLVASAKAGKFDSIVLVDGKGNPIPNQELVNGSASNSQGSTFGVLLPVPAGTAVSQTIKVQTQQNGEVVSTATTSSTLTTTEGVAIVNTLPSAVFLTKSAPEQTVTFNNTGDATAQLQSLVANNPNVEVSFNSSTLETGATTTATLKLKDPTVPATSGDVTLTYNNGQEDVNNAMVVDQNVNPAPTPSPTPAPTPAPGPSPTPTPVAGLTATLSPDNNFFTTTAEAVTRQMTITNTGDTDENGIALTLPANFTISNGSNNSCMVSGNNITNTLDTTANKSCDVTVTYANNSLTTADTADITINYNYNGNTAAPPVPVSVNYRVTAPPVTVTITPTTSWQAMMGGAYALTATITGGSSTVTPEVMAGLNATTVSPTACNLNSAVPATSSCTFIVTPYTGTGYYSFWDPTNIANSTDTSTPSTAYIQSGISLKVTATGTDTLINGNASPYTFNSISGTVIAPYVYLPQTGQTATLPLDVSSYSGADGNVNAGIPWAVAPSGGSTAPNPRFEEVDSGACIKDNLTGLIWVKDLSTVNNGNTISNIANAMSIAANGTWCGQLAGSWRVPNINELRSLLNYSYANQADWLMYGAGNSITPDCDGACFAGVVATSSTNGLYWSSTVTPSASSYEQVIHMFTSNVSTVRQTIITGQSPRLFPVRGGE